MNDTDYLITAASDKRLRANMQQMNSQLEADML